MSLSVKMEGKPSEDTTLQVTQSSWVIREPTGGISHVRSPSGRMVDVLLYHACMACTVIGPNQR